MNREDDDGDDDDDDQVKEDEDKMDKQYNKKELDKSLQKEND